RRLRHPERPGGHHPEARLHGTGAGQDRGPLTQAELTGWLSPTAPSVNAVEPRTTRDLGGSSTAAGIDAPRRIVAVALLLLAVAEAEAVRALLPVDYCYHRH